MNYDEYLQNEREFAEGGEPYDKVYVVLDITNRIPIPYPYKELAESAYDTFVVLEPEGRFDLGWVSEKDVCSDFDYMSSSKVFNPLF